MLTVRSAHLQAALQEQLRRPPARSAPDSVAGAAVSPAALHLAEAHDAAFLPPQAAPRPIDEVDAWLGVDREMQEQADHLPVGQDARLSRA